MLHLATLYLLPSLYPSNSGHLLSLAQSCTPLAIQRAMDHPLEQDYGFLLMRILFKLNGPAKLGQVNMLPTRGVIADFLSDEWPREDGPRLIHFRLSEFRNFSATFISPMPPAWIAVIGNTGHVFQSGDAGCWYHVLALAVDHILDNSIGGRRPDTHRNLYSDRTRLTARAGVYLGRCRTPPPDASLH